MQLDKVVSYFYPYTILDIGANIGQFHQTAKYYFPESYIFSVEASEECEQYLKQITDNYYIGLLSKDEAEYKFYCNDNPISTGNSIYKELTNHYKDDIIKVKNKNGIKLDNLFNKDTYFDLIKIDTQGSELDIIDGGLNMCKKSKGILLEVSITQYNQGSPLYDEVISFMKDLNFEKAEVLDETNIPGVVIQQDILFINKNNI